VVIVGAGLTGLTTAYELRKGGIETVLLESAPNPGGRIQTVTFGDRVHVEAHMEEYWARSPAYALLRELKVSVLEDVAHSTVRLDGAIFPYQGDGDRDQYLRGIFSEGERDAFLKWNAKVWNLHEQLRETESQRVDPRHGRARDGHRMGSDRRPRRHRRDAPVSGLARGIWREELSRERR
jgi:monoamine oxidase